VHQCHRNQAWKALTSKLILFYARDFQLINFGFVFSKKRLLWLESGVENKQFECVFANRSRKTASCIKTITTNWIWEDSVPSWFAQNEHQNASTFQAYQHGFVENKVTAICLRCTERERLRCELDSLWKTSCIIDICDFGYQNIFWSSEKSRSQCSFVCVFLISFWSLDSIIPLIVCKLDAYGILKAIIWIASLASIVIWICWFSKSISA